jgi:hypothetical protein
MKTLRQTVFIIITCLVFWSCSDQDQVKKYQALKLETIKLIEQTNLVIKDQKVKFDSLNKIGDDYINHIIPTMDVDGVHRAIENTIDVQAAMTTLQLDLESIKLYSTILEKANTRFGYFLKRKGKIKTDYTKLILDTNSEINIETGGLTTKAFINKYLPEKYK